MLMLVRGNFKSRSHEACKFLPVAAKTFWCQPPLEEYAMEAIGREHSPLAPRPRPFAQRYSPAGGLRLTTEAVTEVTILRQLSENHRGSRSTSALPAPQSPAEVRTGSGRPQRGGGLRIFCFG